MEVKDKFHITFTLTPKESAPNGHAAEGYVHPSQSGHCREENCYACVMKQIKIYWLSI
jgi:hypothetical protein